MKNISKTVAAMIVGTSLSFGANIAVNDDPFTGMDKIFEMQMKQIQMMREQMQRVFTNFEKAFNTPTMGTMPVTLNSSEILSSGFQDRGDHYELKLKVNDIKNSKIDISTENSMLNIKITQNRKEESTKGNYGKIITYNNSTSMQSFTLPPDADALKIEAKESGDIITVTLPKKSGSRKIEIKKVSNSTKENNSSN